MAKFTLDKSMAKNGRGMASTLVEKDEYTKVNGPTTRKMEEV